MSSADATGTAVTAAQLETLRVAQLTQAPESLDRAAGEMKSRSDSADVSDPLGAVAASIRTVRAELDALDALGYREATTPPGTTRPTG